MTTPNMCHEVILIIQRELLVFLKHFTVCVCVHGFCLTRIIVSITLQSHFWCAYKCGH